MPPTAPDQPGRPVADESGPEQRTGPGARRTDQRAERPESERRDRPASRTPGPADRSGGRGPRVPEQRPGGPARRGRAPLAVAAAVATGWAALLSYLPVAVVLGAAQLAEDAGTIAGAARTGLAGWLLGHGVPLSTEAGPLGLPPLAIAMFAAWRVARAGVHVSRAVGAREHPTLGRALAVAGAVGIGYGALGGLAALLLRVGGGPAAPPLRAVLTLTLFGGLAALVGALRTTGALGTLARNTPAVFRDGLRTGVVAAFLLLGAGAGVAGLAVATGGGEAGDMIGAYRTGVAGQAGITLVSLGYAPNAAVWAASYLLGPGFAVGTDTIVRTSEVSVGALPAVPLLAGLPHGPLGGFGDAVLAVPLLAGMAAGWLLARRMARVAVVRNRTAPGWATVLGAAAVGGPVAGVLLGGAAFMSGGPLGDGRLAEVGPVAWQVSAGATVVMLIGTLVGAAAARAVAPD
ncbi:cell division protein PerM [Plantactinospora sp. CA-290183]|uniref:cell division protein PerM n=1 Tax=Plantactinospora sp. CA-290183 TaxID=3240006 RepID=UPI003D910FD7